jgi:hypothetical protein
MSGDVGKRRFDCGSSGPSTKRSARVPVAINTRSSRLKKRGRVSRGTSGTVAPRNAPARQIWEREGKPDGRAAAHWDIAREEIAVEAISPSRCLPNPAGDGQEFAADGDEAEPVTAAEEAFGDSGPAAQGEQAPYPLIPAAPKRTKLTKKQ